jgi:hypothetical protein
MGMGIVSWMEDMAKTLEFFDVLVLLVAIGGSVKMRGTVVIKRIVD